MKKLAWIAALAALGSLLWLRPRDREQAPESRAGERDPAAAVENVAPAASAESDAVARARPEPAERALAPQASPAPDGVVPVPAPSSSMVAEVSGVKPDNTATLEAIRRAAARYDASAALELDRYLLHADPEVREAARDGMVQAGDAAAVPYLRAAAGKMQDPREAILLLDAADFLELPAALPVTKTPKPAAPGGEVGR